MITISKPMSTSHTLDYFFGDDADDGGEILVSFTNEEINPLNFQFSKTIWSGEISKTFNLNKEIKKTDFIKVLDGINPITDEKLIRHRKKKKDDKKVEPEQPQKQDGKTAEHRAGWDITFSSPKSVSLAAIIGGDKRLILAHRQSVSVALKEIETFAEARLGGNKPAKKTGKLLIASFEHYTARPDKKEKFAAVDLHTHNVVMNFTFIENGNSYSLQTQKIFEAQKFGTAVYRLELAKQMNKIGYQIRLDEKTSAPEIANISREYIDEVSPRQNEIKAKARELGISSTRGIVVRYRSAKNKKNVDNNVEHHRRIEQKFNNEAVESVKKSLIQKEIKQSEIIGALQIKVDELRQQITVIEAEEQLYQHKRNVEKLQNERSTIEIKTRETEAKHSESIIKEQRIANIYRNIGNKFTNAKASLSSNLESERAVDVRNGAERNNIGNANEFHESAKNARPKNSNIGNGIDQNELEVERGIKLENRFDRTDSQNLPSVSGKTGESAKSNSSKSLARSRATQTEIIDKFSDESSKNQPASERINSQYAEPDQAEASFVELSTNDPNKYGISTPHARDEKNVHESEAETNIATSYSSKISTSNYVDGREFNDSFDHTLHINNSINSPLDNLHISTRDTVVSDALGETDFNNSSGNHFPFMPENVENEYADYFSRIDNNICNNSESAESNRDIGRFVHKFREQFFDAEQHISNLSVGNETVPNSYAESQKQEFSNQFEEIEKIFETQNQKEIISRSLVEMANNLSLQNRQSEINQVVQDRMFAYFMQMSDVAMQNNLSTNIGNETSEFNNILQNAKNNPEVLENLTSHLEKIHQEEESEKQEVRKWENSKNYEIREVIYEEMEYYEHDELPYFY